MIARSQGWIKKYRWTEWLPSENGWMKRSDKSKASYEGGKKIKLSIPWNIDNFFPEKKENR